jgi:hypothetical protein
MLIRYQSGGTVAGPAGVRALVVDTDKLPNAEADHVRSLVAAADLPALARRKAPARPPRPDEAWYEINVEDGATNEAVSGSRMGMSPGLSALVKWLDARTVGG